ncbi:protein-glutamate O-methyltransferase [Anoxybacter fermentans]|uniref:Protein-glutamate O-methyltransferase n=1 Tax=Anoxybacter fermentans TaxID=1323375 RepID=A0A3Q9HRN9_9FIRM|nr:protein-glutamate O-methyltransferase CheR [Anoxybacter fermentans]AZR74220.1 protein-glutamate O-methyltransferase [Anoxybacter fermentans]
MITFEEFKTQASKILGLNLSSYKAKRVQRRVESLMRRRNIPDYTTCLELLRNNSNFRADFLNHFTINTSEFFRNPSNFVTLKNEIFPELFAGGKKVKIWSAPCSNGCEPYSLAIIIDELGIKSHQYEILGVDIDPNILQAAKKGIYNSGALKNVSTERLQKYFKQVGTNTFALSEKIKKMVHFKEFDLLKDTYSKNWDLILCRNFFIYLTSDVKDLLTRKFVDALRPGGILFLGNTEFIFEPEKFGLSKIVSSFYRKI